MSMGAFVVYMLKSALCLAAFYLVYKVLLTSESFHRMNRITLLICMCLSCLIPFVHYSAEVPTLVSQPVMVLEDFIIFNAEPVAAAEVVETPFNWMALIVGIYLMGVLVFSAYHVWSVIQLMLLLKRCNVMHAGDYRVLTHTMQAPPFSFMHTIILSETDLQEHGDIYLEHEKAHIRLGHSYDLMVATLCTVFQWFNPAAWLLKQELQNIHEYEADDAVLNRGIDAKTYQILLIKKAAGARLYSLANSFNHSSLKKRITMMSVKKSSSWARAKYAFVLPVAAVAVAAFARPEVASISQEIGAVSVEDLTAAVDKVTEKVSNLPSPEAKITDANPKDTIYQVVDEAPEFPGGTQALMQFLARNVKYPVEAQKAGKQGRVILQFVVAETGKIVNPVVIRSVDPLLDAEALRVVHSMGDWKPGILKGKAVKTRMTLPVTYTLQGSAVRPEPGENDIVVVGYAPAKTDDEVFMVVEEQPQFPGGMSAMMQYLSSNVKYPEQAAKEGKGGRVVVQFVIDKDGSIIEPRVARGVDPAIDAEALRVVAAMPKWKPGIQKGQPVKVRFTLPVLFNAQKDGETAPLVPGASRIKVEPSDAQTVMVSGTVTDAKTNTPIVGAAVLIVGTTDGTITDTKGNFKIPADKGMSVTVSYLDYKPYTLKVAGITTAEISLSK